MFTCAGRFSELKERKCRPVVIAPGSLRQTVAQVVVTTGADGTEELKVGMVAGTMVMAPPPLMDLEQRFCKALPLITSWAITDSRLDLRGEAVEMDFIHYDAPPVEPVSSPLP